MIEGCFIYIEKYASEEQRRRWGKERKKTNMRGVQYISKAGGKEKKSSESCDSFERGQAKEGKEKDDTKTFKGPIDFRRRALGRSSEAYRQ